MVRYSSRLMRGSLVVDCSVRFNKLPRRNREQEHAIMAMKVGIAGFAGSGKSTVFAWLTGVKPDPAKVQSGQTGHAPIPDPRLDWLFQHFKPKRNQPIYASI